MNWTKIEDGLPVRGELVLARLTHGDHVIGRLTYLRYVNKPHVPQFLTGSYGGVRDRFNDITHWVTITDPDEVPNEC